MKKTLIAVLCLSQVVYSEVTFHKISGEADLVIELSRGGLKNILLECKDIAKNMYDCQGEYDVRIRKGVEKGESYTSAQSGERKLFTKDDPNRIVIIIEPVVNRRRPISMKGGGWYDFYLDETNISIEGFTGYK